MSIKKNYTAIIITTLALLSLPVQAEDKPAIAPQKTEIPATTAETKPLPSAESLAALLPDDHMLGEVNAPVTVIEYASLSCSHCASFHKEVFPALKGRYIDTGKIRFIYRNFPLNAPALSAAMLTQCVEKDRYFNFIKVLFKTQDSWAFEKNYVEILANIAKLGGMTGEQFDKCMQNETLRNEILDKRLTAAKVLTIDGTPTFFIDGQKYPGAGVEEFSKLLDGILAKKAESAGKTVPEKG